MPEAPLITLDEAKAHLGITHDDADADLNDKLLAAEQIIFDYLEQRDQTMMAEIAAWTAETLPRSVRAAMLVKFGELTIQRGDEDQAPVAPTPVSLSATVMALLMKYRDRGYA